MKHLFLFLLFLLPVLLSAQDPLPANPRKLRLGYQTDGEGIVLYGSGVPSYTPTRYRSAFHYMDTTNNIYYQYNRIEAKWDTILAGAGAVADGVSVDNSTWSKIGGTDVQQALTKTDSVLNNITIEGGQIANKFEAVTTTLTVSSDTLTEKNNYSIVVRNASSGASTRVLLPQPSTTLGGEVLTVIDSSAAGSLTFIEVDTAGSNELTWINVSGFGKASRYYLDRNEQVNVVYQEGKLTITPNRQRLVPNTYEDFRNGYYLVGDEITYNGYRYKVQAAPPATVDNIFSLKVPSKVIGPENLNNKSNNFQQGSAGNGSWNNLTGLDVTTDYATGVTGQTDADLVVKTTAAGTRWGKRTLAMGDGDGSTFPQLLPGQQITWSWYARVPKGSQDTVDLYLAPSVTTAEGNQFMTVYPVDTLWQRYAFSWTLQDTFESGDQLFVYFNNSDVGDSLLVWGGQLERGSLGPYVETPDIANATFPDSLYLTYQLDGNVLKLDKLYRPETLTESEFLQAAIDYCEPLENCEAVELYEGFTFTSGVQLYQRMGLIGPRKQPVFIDLIDTTEIVIRVDGNDGESYTQKAYIEDISFTALSSFKAAIATYNTLGFRASRINVSGTGQYCDAALILGNHTSGLNDLESKWEDIEISTLEGRGIWTKSAGNRHMFKEITISRVHQGIYAEGGQLSIVQNARVEEIDSIGIYWEPSRTLFNGLYFESQMLDENSGGAAMYFNGTAYTVVKNVRMQVSGLDTNEHVLRFQDCGPISFEGWSGTGDILVDGVTEDDVECFTFSGTAQLGTGSYLKYQFRNHPCANILASSQTKQQITNGRFPNLEISGGSLDEGFLGDTIFTSNLTLSDRTENLIAYSDSVQADRTGTWTTVTDDYEDGPKGPGADLVVTQTSIGGIDRVIYSQSPTEAINAGEDVTVSFWYRRANATIYNGDSTLGGSAASVIGGGKEVFIGDLISLDWHKVTTTLHDVPSNVGNVILNYQNLRAGDSLLVAHFQVNRGPVALPFVATNGTAKTAGSTINIKSTGPVTIDSLNNRAFDGGELYILPTDPDTLDFSAAGGLFDQIQDMTIGTLDNFTSSGDTLYYTGSVTRPFTVNFTATLEADTGSQELQMRITKNAASIDKCTVSKDYSTSGVEVQITGTCRIDLSTNDAIALEVSPTQNTSQLLVRRANINLH